MKALYFLQSLCTAHPLIVALVAASYLTWFVWRHHVPRSVLGKPRSDCIAPRFRDNYRVGGGSIRHG